MPKGRCVFNPLWLEAPDFKGWIAELKDDQSHAWCKLCKKKVDIRAMGQAALNKHKLGKKHLEMEKASEPAVPMRLCSTHGSKICCF